MDEDGFTIVTWIVLAASALVVVLVLTAGGLWLADFGVEATVVEKDCLTRTLGGDAGSEVTVRTKLFNIEHTVSDVDNAVCHGLRAGDDGNYVVHHIRSGHTIVYESEGGRCLWDSKTGPC